MTKRSKCQYCWTTAQRNSGQHHPACPAVLNTVPARRFWLHGRDRAWSRRPYPEQDLHHCDPSFQLGYLETLQTEREFDEEMEAEMQAELDQRWWDEHPEEYYREVSPRED